MLTLPLTLALRLALPLGLPTSLAFGLAGRSHLVVETKRQPDALACLVHFEDLHLDDVT